MEGYGVNEDLCGEVVEEGLHFAGGVVVAGACRGCEAFVEASDRFFVAVELGEGLRGHLVGGDVVGIVLDEEVEFVERFGGVVFGGVGHGEAVTGEGVGGVLLEGRKSVV